MPPYYYQFIFNNNTRYCHQSLFIHLFLLEFQFCFKERFFVLDDIFVLQFISENSNYFQFICKKQKLLILIYHFIDSLLITNI